MRSIADFLGVLADESRLTMLWLLSNHDEICVCDLMRALDVTQSKASRHLATLRHAGLVSDRREGTWSYYSLRRPEGTLQKALLKSLQSGLAAEPEAAAALRRLEDARKDRCGVRAAVAGPSRDAPRIARRLAPVPR